MRHFYNFDSLQINSILSNKLKLCVTNSCFLCHWECEPEATHLKRASLVFCKVAFKGRHYGAPQLSALSALLFRVAAISCTPSWEASLKKKLLRQKKEPAMSSRGDSRKPGGFQPKPKRASAWWGTWDRFHMCRFFSVLTTSAIYYGVQMTVYAMLSGYLRKCSLRMLPDQETSR